MVNESINAAIVGCKFPTDLAFDSISQVRRASKKLCESPHDDEALIVLDSYRKFRLACIKASLSLLRSVHLPSHTLISARLKRIESICRKMTRSHTSIDAANQMDDIIGFRIICRSYLEAMSVRDRFAEKDFAKIKDYVGSEHRKRGGYRAVHVIARFRQPFKDKPVVARFEIQVRTWFQHCWACWCEAHGEQIKEFDASLSECIDGETKSTINDLISLSKKIAYWEEVNQGKTQFDLPQLGDLYQVAVATIQPEGENFLVQCGTDVNVAFDNVRYNETKQLHSLLLLGVDVENRDLECLLSMTHPKFVGSKFTYPEDWMPK